ncbi:MAG: hypothetical protein RLZZ58_884 [Pseudomonadota bacterium]
MSRLIALLAVMLALLAAPAAGQTTRGVFVGIDTYLYSETGGRVPGAGFKDLNGAVGDTIRFKNALRTNYDLRKLDMTRPGSCPPATPVDPRTPSISLYNQCATRAEIIKALTDMIAVSQPKDTLIFYFAGHGAQYADDARQDQATGFHGTILPHDARKPNDEANAEIFDYELKAIKESAVAKGVYFVSVFDSCNSGTATREGGSGEGRSAPMLTGAPPTRAIARATEGPGGGYWVHFGAALDGQLALESGTRDGKPAGVFTSTLIDTLDVMPRAAFGDIIREVQARMITAGYTKQTPVAEGELRASLGTAPGEGTSFAVTHDRGKLTMAAGRLSGITSGSTFSIFNPKTNMLTGAVAPVGIARVGKVDDFTAVLTFEAAPAADVPDKLVAVEKMRDYGVLGFPVTNLMTAAPEKKAVNAALESIPFVTKGKDPPVKVAPAPGKPGHAVLRARDDVIVAELGAVADADFDARLADRLKKVWRVQQLLMLGVGNRPAGSGIRFCIDAARVMFEGKDVANTVRGVATDCPGGANSLPIVPRDRDNLVTIENQAAKPRFLYVLGIDPAFGVSVILPASAGNDARLAPRKPLGDIDDPVRLTQAGTYHFVTIATDEPISAAALEQQGTNARGGPACSSALEILLCNAGSGTRDPKAPRVGNWNAIVTSVIVK